MDCLAGSCACGCFRPKWRRSVDNIYPADAEDGIVRNSMQKLTFYALSAPEKLDRIGQYLAKRLSRDIVSNRLGYVRVAMEAMDQLLAACHAQMLNLFVESFLKMVQSLLECEDAELQCMATLSFVKFSQIEEDTASYHRRYDFFVSKFSAMCHSSETQSWVRIRLAGIQGIQGVIRKTVSDDLQVNIWDHMDKIVPSLLYNIAHKSDKSEAPSSSLSENPPEMAEQVFRDLVCRACFGNLRPTLSPVLKHIDNHKLWEETAFAERVFKMIIFSVQDQYGHIVIQALMSHLDSHSKSPAFLKASITGVLGVTVKIAAGGSIGPSVLDVFNSLLRHLRTSIEEDSSPSEENVGNKRFQEAIINAIGEFSNHLPDYQKVEIMMFVLSKVPTGDNPSEYDSSGEIRTRLQTTILRTILTVATSYRTNIMANAFPSQFTERLLKMGLTRGDSTTRLLALQTIGALLDRHNNSAKLNNMALLQDCAVEMDTIQVDKPSNQDLYFMKKNGFLFMGHLVESFCMEGNRPANIKASYLVIALMVVEMGSEETLCQFLNLALHVQENACSDDTGDWVGSCQCHAVLAPFLYTLCDVLNVSQLSSYITQVISARKSSAPYLLPAVAFSEEFADTTGVKVSEDCLFLKEKMLAILTESGVDVSELDHPCSHKIVPGLSTEGKHLDEIDGPKGTVDFHVGIAPATSKESDLGSLNFDSDSMDSSPVPIRKRSETEPVTFASLKRMMDMHRPDHEAYGRKQEEILHEFQTASFEQIRAKGESQWEIYHKMRELIAPDEDEETNLVDQNQPMISLDEIVFPVGILL